ncbi:MAG TPA: CRTAC1 family protein, partial [Planctomycetia bacterium]|nr:CRTAC1 family protein [Planctomycetia bacterium]
LYLTNFGGDALYLNRGGGRFARVEAGGLDNRRWATSAAFFDFDRDGRLDLYVCNYCDYKPPVQCKLNNGRVDYCAPVGFAGTIHRLYRNETRPGAKDPSEIRFRDVTVAAGIAAKPGRGLGALPVDFDDDGWPDLYVANDAERNFAWRNLRNGGFEDAAAELNVAVDGVGRSQASMGLAEGDVDGDGRPDIVATSFRSEYTILYRAGKHAFEDASARYGLPASTRRYTGFGVALEDFDGDGNLDLVQANGMVTQPDAAAGALPPADPLKDPAGVAAFWRLYAEPMVFLKGDGRTFRESLTAAGELAKLHAVARGLAVGDLDGDARPDLVVVPSATPARLFHCAGNQAGRRLSLRLVDPNLGGRDALGAKVVACVGEYRRIATLRTASSYQSASEPTIRLGLGKRDGPVRIEVRWPSGDPTPEVFENVPADRPATLRRGEGRIK